MSLRTNKRYLNSIAGDVEIWVNNDTCINLSQSKRSHDLKEKARKTAYVTSPKVILILIFLC